MHRLLLSLLFCVILPLPFVRAQAPSSAQPMAQAVTGYWLPLGTLMLLVLLISAFPWWNLSQARRRLAKRERQLSLCRLQLLQARLDPHFLDNVLVNLQELVRRREADQAVEQIGRLSRLLRGFIAALAEGQGPRPVEILLEEELELLRQYLELERFQHPNPFTYAIEVHPSVRPDDEFIFPRIIQPIVENAIRHGLPLEGAAGHIRIGLIRGDGQLICTVEDGGGNAKAPSDAGKRRPLGRQLVEEQIALLRDLGRNIDIRHDRTTSGGTLVTLTFETV